MSLRVAIIADDLTGALDSSIPFALAGLRVAVAVRPRAAGAMMASRPDVAVVNTASRALLPADAAAVVAEVGHGLAQRTPEVAFKKIDSRLKGNPAVEIEAARRALGRARAVVAPAVPDQGRWTIEGAVTGRGLDAPLPIAPLVPPDAIIAEAQTHEDIVGLLAAHDARETLFVGARGLGQALAERFRPGRAAPFTRRRATLFAIGSQDVITLEQVAHLIESRPGLDRRDAPRGTLERPVDRLPALVRALDLPAPPDAALRRFADDIAAAVGRLRPDVLVLSGGDTAIAVLDGLGASVIFPQGEAAPGLPWFLVEPPNGRPIRCVVKSGGFGDTNVLSELLPQGR